MAQIINRGPNKYLIRIYLGRDAAGHQSYHNETFRGSASRARKRARALETERDEGILFKAPTATVSTYFEAWLETVKGNVAPRTHYDYSVYFERYLKPEIGNILLADLSPLHLQRVYSGMKLRNFSPRTIRYAHSIVSQALGQAVKWGLLQRNVAKLASVPKLIQKERRYLSPDQVQRFLAAADNDRWRPLWYLAVETGMRPEEFLGLRWSSVSLDRREVRVERVLVRSRIKGEGWSLEEPKTQRSRRSIVISGQTAQMLRVHRRQQKEARLKSDEQYEDHDLVFATPIGTPLSLGNLSRRHFKPMLTKAKLPDVRIYDMRHACATLLLSAGESAKVVSERLGHAGVRLTLDTYSHVTPTMQEEATRKMAAIIFPAKRRKG